MSFARYPKYKDSGVDWLGEVPGHWILTKVKRLAARISSGKTPLGGSENYVDDGILFLRSQNVYDEGLRLQDVAFISEGTDESMAVSRVIPGDILLNITGASIGRSCVVPQNFSPANVNQHVCAIRLRDGSQSQAMAWVFKSSLIKNQIDLAQNGAAREGLNFEQIGGMIIVIPPPAEQSAIAIFLDRETAKIDALVAEQEKLIALLQEKRQAVISHAVTKGLDPNVPMKDSGVEWLGEVPAHWEVRRVKDYFQTCSGGTPNTGQQALYYTDEENGIPWVRTTDLQNGILSNVEVFITEQALLDTACSILPQGTVMVAMYGGDGTVGKNGLLAIAAAINQAVCGLLPSSTHSSEYAFRFMQFYRPHWMIGAESSRKDPNISQERVRNAPFPRPPREEQEAIATFLDHQLKVFDNLTAEAQSAIALLQERRTALISAAVTGQIDVRGLAPMEAV